MVEKWNQHISEHGGNTIPPEKRDLIYKRMHEAPNYLEEIPKLEKTEKELKIIADLNLALNKYLYFIGLDPIEIPESEIYIVDENYYKSTYLNGTRAHHVVSGIHSRILIPRTSDELADLKNIAHEMVHHASYRRTKLEIISREDGQFDFGEGDTYRSGFKFGMVENGQVLNFEGLNEAITEFIAYRVRREYFKMKGLDGDELETKAGMNCYIFEFDLLYGVLQKYKQLEKAEKSLLVDIQRGYFLGDMTPLKKLQIVHPDAVRLLRDMKHSDFNSLIETAEGFGLTEYADFLKDKREKLA